MQHLPTEYLPSHEKILFSSGFKFAYFEYQLYFLYKNVNSSEITLCEEDVIKFRAQKSTLQYA